MFQYFMTLGIYSAVAFLVLCFASIKRLPENIGLIANIIMWYTLLNFADMFPWFSFGKMNWTGKLLVPFILTILMIYKKLRNEEGFVSFAFDNKNKKIIVVTAIIYLFVGFSSLVLLLANNIFNIERFIMNIILVGISEELMFRGLLYRKILSLKNEWQGKKYLPIIVCSILFGMIHIYFFRLTFTQNIVQFVSPFILGFVLSLFYEKSRNILVPILVHNIVDTLGYVGWAVLDIYFFDIGGGSL